MTYAKHPHLDNNCVLPHTALALIIHYYHSLPSSIRSLADPHHHPFVQTLSLAKSSTAGMLWTPSSASLPTRSTGQHPMSSWSA